MRRRRAGGEEKHTTVVRANADPHPDPDTATGSGDAITTDIGTRTMTTRRGALVSTAAAALLAQSLAAPGPSAARSLAVVRSAPVAASAGEISLSIALPPGYHFTEGANSRFKVTVVGDGGGEGGERGGGVTDGTAAATTAGAASPLTVEPTAGKLMDGQDVRLTFSTAAAAGAGAGGGGGGG
jgi:hypothetical protein